MPKTPHSEEVTFDRLPWGLELRSVHCAGHHRWDFEAVSAKLDELRTWPGMSGADADVLGPLDGMAQGEEERFLAWWKDHQDCENADVRVIVEAPA